MSVVGVEVGVRLEVGGYAEAGLTDGSFISVFGGRWLCRARGSRDGGADVSPHTPPCGAAFEPDNSWTWRWQSEANRGLG